MTLDPRSNPVAAYHIQQAQEAAEAAEAARLAREEAEAQQQADNDN